MILHNFPHLVLIFNNWSVVIPAAQQRAGALKHTQNTNLYASVRAGQLRKLYASPIIHVPQTHLPKTQKTNYSHIQNISVFQGVKNYLHWENLKHLLLIMWVVFR